MIPQYTETFSLLYARLTFVAFMTQRYGPMDVDELSAMVVLCNRMIARNPKIELMQLLITETTYAKPDGSGYEIPKLRETLDKHRKGQLDPDFAAFAKDIKCLDNGKYESTEIRFGWRLPELSGDYLRYIQDYLIDLRNAAWPLKRLLSVANKYPEMAAALKEPDLRVWDDMHLLEASPDIPNLGELTDAQKELKYSE